VKASLCADVDGFSLHAAVRVEARDRERLEKLCRYAGRPAIAESRLRLLPDGRVGYSLKKRWKDGTTAVVLEPQVLMERLRRQLRGSREAATRGSASRRAHTALRLRFAQPLRQRALRVVRAGAAATPASRDVPRGVGAGGGDPAAGGAAGRGG